CCRGFRRLSPTRTHLSRASSATGCCVQPSRPSTPTSQQVSDRAPGLRVIRRAFTASHASKLRIQAFPNSRQNGEAFKTNPGAVITNDPGAAPGRRLVSPADEEFCCQCRNTPVEGKPCGQILIAQPYLQ